MHPTKKYHFIGIGGIGMSGLAKLLKEQGEEVTGSDVKESTTTKALQEMGIPVSIGHEASLVQEGQVVIFSSDIAHENVELVKARELSLPLMHRSELLAEIAKTKKMVAVTGTHGKTTTSSLLAFVMEKAQLSPSFVVGGIVPDLGGNAAFGKGDYFVVEADESDGTFLNYHSFGAIITNIDFDHMNFFQTEENLVHAFGRFASQVTGPIFFSGDDARLKSLCKGGISYGFSKECALHLYNVRSLGWGMRFSISFQGKHYEDVELSLIGEHNVMNACAVFGLALSLGVAEEKIREALASFRGAKRRQEKRGEVRSVLVLDDYAHHPTEIEATVLSVAEAIAPRRLIAVYQPHRPSRLKHILGQFGTVFDAADEVVITDLYTAGEKEVPQVTGQSVFDEVRQTHSRVHFMPKEEILHKLTSFVRPHDVVLMMGAGDISLIAGELVEDLQKRPLKRLTVGVVRGGRSEEHEISLISALHVAASLDPELYDVKFFTISKGGEWSSNDFSEIDMFFPVLHGPFGEDGTIQGFFEILGKPYVGPDFRGAAIAMDKVLTKRLVAAEGIPTKPFFEVRLHAWRFRRRALLKEIQETMQFPLFVKPPHLGSSIGVIKVSSFEELEKAMSESFAFDSRLMLEEAVPSPREIEFCVLGTDDPQVFPPGEVLTGGKVYDYKAKYSSESMKTTVDPELSSELCKKGMELALRVFEVTGCEGMARVDFFLDKAGHFWLNEINPIPGFTEISLYPKVLERHGIPSKELMNKLVQLGLQRKRRQRC